MKTTFEDISSTPTRDINKWTLTDGSAKPAPAKKIGYPQFKEDMVTELKRAHGVKHYYADCVVIDAGTLCYKGFDAKNTVEDWAFVMMGEVTRMYGKFNCMVRDDGPVME